jgi:hypothetical protein
VKRRQIQIEITVLVQINDGFESGQYRQNKEENENKAFYFNIEHITKEYHVDNKKIKIY